MEGLGEAQPTKAERLQANTACDRNASLQADKGGGRLLAAEMLCRPSAVLAAITQFANDEAPAARALHARSALRRQRRFAKWQFELSSMLRNVLAGA